MTLPHQQARFNGLNTFNYDSTAALGVLADLTSFDVPTSGAIVHIDGGRFTVECQDYEEDITGDVTIVTQDYARQCQGDIAKTFHGPFSRVIESQISLDYNNQNTNGFASQDLENSAPNKDSEDPEQKAAATAATNAATTLMRASKTLQRPLHVSVADTDSLTVTGTANFLYNQRTDENVHFYAQIVNGVFMENRLWPSIETGLISISINGGSVVRAASVVFLLSTLDFEFSKRDVSTCLFWGEKIGILVHEPLDWIENWSGTYCVSWDLLCQTHTGGGQVLHW